MYSAIKVQGQKLYDLARDGQTIERVPRPVSITRFEVRREAGSRQDVSFLVECSKVGRGRGGVASSPLPRYLI